MTASGPDLRQDLVPPGFPHEHLELTPPSFGPAVAGQPGAEQGLKVSRLVRSAFSLERAFRASFAQHFQVKSGHKATITPDARQDHGHPRHDLGRAA